MDVFANVSIAFILGKKANDILKLTELQDIEVSNLCQVFTLDIKLKTVCVSVVSFWNSPSSSTSSDLSLCLVALEMKGMPTAKKDVP
jgi:hypothetical protein